MTFEGPFQLKQLYDSVSRRQLHCGTENTVIFVSQVMKWLEDFSFMYGWVEG